MAADAPLGKPPIAAGQALLASRSSSAGERSRDACHDTAPLSLPPSHARSPLLLHLEPMQPRSELTPTARVEAGQSPQGEEAAPVALRVQGARLRHGAVDLSTLCRHFLRGSCLYGSRCAFVHQPPAELLPPRGPADAMSETLAKCELEYRKVEISLNQLRRDGASSDQLIPLAMRLQSLRRERLQLLPAVERKPFRHKKRNSGRAGALRRFLLETYGVEALQAGSGVLDVAGGQGALAFELLNLNEVPVTVIDPRPTLQLDRLVKKWRRGLYHLTQPLQHFNTAAPPTPNAGEDTIGNVADQSEENRQLRHPRHWRMRWRDGVWRPVLDLSSAHEESSTAALARLEEALLAESKENDRVNGTGEGTGKMGTARATGEMEPPHVSPSTKQLGMQHAGCPGDVPDAAEASS
ncbi:MAG: hypothetical protein SGPRY_008166, partial [Prymnesium sp.]